MHRFSKFEVLNGLELSRKQIRTSKSVLEYIFWLLLIINRISHMGQFELKSFFAGGGGVFFHGNEKWLK